MSRRWRGEQLAFMPVSPSILSRVGWKCAIKIVPPPISSHVDVWCSRNRLTEEEKRRKKRISRVLLLLRFSFDRRRIVAKNFTRETPLSRVHYKIFSPSLAEKDNAAGVVVVVADCFHPGFVFPANISQPMREGPGDDGDPAGCLPDAHDGDRGSGGGGLLPYETDSGKQSVQESQEEAGRKK